MASYSCTDLPSGLPEGDSGVAAGSRISAYNALAMSPVGGPWLPGQPGYVHQRGDFQPRVQQLVTVKG